MYGLDTSGKQFSDFDPNKIRIRINNGANQENQLEHFANAQLAKILASSGSAFEGISLQGM